MLVLIDQLRKDAADRWCPHLTALATHGIVFDEMRSVAPWTYPAVISLFSGLYPQQHGADGDLSSDRLTTFDPGVPLLHRTLRGVGYDTAAFVTNPFLHTWNPFHEGFGLYVVDFIKTQGNRRLERPAFATSRMFADAVNDAIVEAFDRRPFGVPEFTYIHYIDVHGPWNQAPFQPTYEAAVRFIDQRIVEIYHYFRRRYRGDFLFVVTSDHGRALDDDEEIGHGRRWRKMKRSVHDFNLRVPFMVLPSNLVHEPRIVREPSSSVDVVPTLLDWLVVRANYPMPGRSLMRAIRGDNGVGATRPIYAKVSAFDALSDCLVFRGRKYMRSFDVRTGGVIKTWVFDLADDPDETQSIPGEFREMERLLQDAAGTQGLSYPAVYDELSPDVEQRLRALGYLQ